MIEDTGTRKMATIRRIGSLAPIKKADRIEAATVDGWPVVVKKGDFSVGDPCVFMEIDTFVPEGAAFFSPKTEPMDWDGKRGWRLSTQTMRGQLSQGLALPLAAFPGFAEDHAAGRLPPGSDVTAAIGVLRWEAEIPEEIRASVIGALPWEIGRTSLERVQNALGRLADEHAGTTFEATLKIDGMSTHVFRLGGRVRVAAGNWELRDTEDSLVWRAARRAGLIDALDDDSFEGFQVQSELIGTDFGSGYHEGRDLALITFHVRDNLARRDLGRDERIAFIEGLRARGARIETAPTLGTITLKGDAGDMSELAAFVEGPGLDGSRRREGAVFRRLDGAYAFKFVSNGSLLAGTAS